MPRSAPPWCGSPSPALYVLIILSRPSTAFPTFEPSPIPFVVCLPLRFSVLGVVHGCCPRSAPMFRDLRQRSLGVLALVMMYLRAHDLLSAGNGARARSRVLLFQIPSLSRSDPPARHFLADSGQTGSRLPSMRQSHGCLLRRAIAGFSGSNPALPMSSEAIIEARPGWARPTRSIAGPKID